MYYGNIKKLVIKYNLRPLFFYIVLYVYNVNFIFFNILLYLRNTT